MADFQPKFVDLVRNTTTTVGTLDFALGPPVMGYTSFTVAVQIGDSFYYSAIGVDKPNEREVGRGTLQANGTISRNPISGTKTNFSMGNKTVALIAAAEWYSQVQAGANAGTRAALAALPGSRAAVLLCEAGREGMFAWDGSNQSANVAVDTAQGIYVAPTSDPTGASGAWVRRFHGDAFASWFGFTADDQGGQGTDNAPAVEAAIATLKAMRLPLGNVTGYGAGGSIGLYIQGAGYVSRRIVVSHALRIHGAGQGNPGGTGTQLRWPAGTEGFLFDVGSGGWRLEDLTLKGGWTSGDEAENHAVQWFNGGTRRNLFIANWEGDALYDVNDAASTGGLHNSNQDLTDRVFVQSCRRGYYCQGGDVNAKEIRGLTCISNRWCGIHEKGFFGNGYYNPTTESNGFYPNWTTGAANRPACYVQYNGRIFACVGGQESWCSTNPPASSATNNQGWIYWADGSPDPLGSGIPLWFSGITMRAGGGVIHQGDSNRSVFVNLYSEGNQYNQFDVQAVLISPIIDGNYAAVNASSGTLYPRKPAAIRAGGAQVNIPTDLSLGGSIFATGPIIEFGPESGSGPDVETRFNTVGTGGHKVVFNRYDSGGVPQEEIGYLWAVNGGSLYINGRTEIPLRIGGAPIATVNAAGLSVSGAVSATGAIGYAPGAGGAVTQATDKSTGVILNKLCGQITTSAAALAAGGGVSFTVTNSQVAATDTIELVLASGNAATGTYAYQVEAVGSGSFAISVRNVSGGALAEALVFNFAVKKAVAA